MRQILSQKITTIATLRFFISKNAPKFLVFGFLVFFEFQYWGNVKNAVHLILRQDF
jgi:hypothetical protein